MKKVTLDYCGRKETLPFTKDCLIDISRVIPKVTGVKFRISPGNITYPKFLSQLTKLCHFTGELSGVDSSGALREGVTNIHLFHIQSIYKQPVLRRTSHEQYLVLYSESHAIFNDFTVANVCVFFGRFFRSVLVIIFFHWGMTLKQTTLEINALQADTQF